jgi:hypothetical protein
LFLEYDNATETTTRPPRTQLVRTAEDAIRTDNTQVLPPSRRPRRALLA